MSFADLLSHWRTDDQTAPNFAAWRTLPARPADLRPIPADLSPALKQLLHRQGIFELYSHQAEAWEHARHGENIILSTGTASGKTLSYNLPILAALETDPAARALYLFPTKALAQDQLNTLSRYQMHHFGLSAAIYDGDTPSNQRPAIRKTANIILSNPDMLHTGILPHHTTWADFFTRLKFIVIDEAHTYRGVFGSHVANVIRRIKRIAAFYGAAPQFMLASATIGNPQELAETLVEAPVHLIDSDGSARGPRHFLIYNPPVTNAALGLRKSSVLEATRLAQDVLREEVQAVIFARSRRSVEVLLTYLQGTPESAGGAVRGYRSGYLPSQRREIERGLRDGAVKAVVATNALELGIDIGGLGAAILVGYPGSISSARQQSGRAGRGLDPAAAVLVTSALPLDQYLAHHPEFFFERSPERALLNPNHLLILLNHLRCAMFELPFTPGEPFGALPAPQVKEFLDFLAASGDAHLSSEKYYWMADSYPAADVSLRSASPEAFLLHEEVDGQPRVIGSVDAGSAFWMVHPGAIYLHEAQSYFVETLDIEHKTARLRPFASDYYTEPLKDTQVTVLAVAAQAETVEPAQTAWGELQVTTRVTGFQKKRWYTHENLGAAPLDLPPGELQTTGYWFSISEQTVKALSENGMWTNAPNDYGPDWPSIRERVRARDKYACQLCGQPESGRQHHVHHKIPFRMFRDESGKILREKANQLDNLTTLCPECHRKAETNVRVRSGLAGLSYLLGNLAPLFLMCDPGDLGTHIEPVQSESFPQPSVVLYDLVPAGIGFSEKLFEMHAELLAQALEVASTCPCEQGCPSCVGPAGENGMGGKQETLALLKLLCAG